MIVMALSRISNMKKIVLAATAFSLALGLAACGETATEEAATDSAIAETTPVEPAPVADPATAEMSSDHPAETTGTVADPMAPAEDPAAADVAAEEAPAE